MTGSGLSASAGLPDWRALRNHIQIRLDNYKASLEYSGVEYDAFLYKETHKTDDYWKFFQLAKNLLGPATFNEIVREELDPSELTVPSAYSSLISLRPKGLVTLNLDRISSIALAEAHPGTPINTIHGSELSHKWHLLREESPFLVHLHGHILDSSTWVLSTSELQALTSGEAHKLFLLTLYMDNTVLFVGVSADDIALSGALLQLMKAGLEPHRPFWLTNRTDAQTTRWASENYIQLIQYRAHTNEEHTEQISTIVNNIRTFRSLDSNPAPIISPKKFNPAQIHYTPDQLSTMPQDAARKSLSDMLLDTLHGSTGDILYDKFFEFCEKYDFPIKTRAFYRHKTLASTFFDYKLQFPELGQGNFGVVYGAEAPNGQSVAVKVMHENILSTREMLGGFRRGSRSMQILTESKIDGVAQLIGAYEMPPTIVMSLVPGNSLEELFSTMPNVPWVTKARIGADVSAIVDKCHKLPEMVLHRDVKPSNIILEGFDYTDGSYTKLVVLDFDMSWHKGSSEKDIVFESRDDFGYLAPEQTDASQIASARSAKVDSYGLGMTLYALFAGRHPIPNMPMSTDWNDTLRRVIRSSYFGEWTCIPVRMARAIRDATHLEQSSRLDFSSFSHRLYRINEVLQSNGTVSSDIFAEEILSRAAGTTWTYEWDDISDTGALKFPGGFTILTSGNVGKSYVDINVSFNDPGGALYKRRDEMLRTCKRELESSFSALDCKVESATVRSGYLNFSAKVAVLRDLALADKITAALVNAMQPIREQR